jgi:hypothetical protein
MRTQQVTSQATAEGGTVSSFVTSEPCQVPTVVNEAVSVQTPVVTQVPVTQSIPIARMVPVVENAAFTSLVPTVATQEQVVSVPRTVMTTVQSPVTYTQYTSPWQAQSSCASNAAIGFGGGCGAGIGGYGMGGFGYGGLGYGALGYGGLGYGGLGYRGFW